MSLLTAVHGRGTTAAKPAAAAANEAYIYYDTTLSRLERSNGTTWDVIEGTAPAAVGARVKRSAVQSIANNTMTAVAWDQEDYDTDAFHDNVTNNSRLTVPTAKGGKYLIEACVKIAANAAGTQHYADIYLNGTTVIASCNGLMHASVAEAWIVTATYALVATDYVQIRVYQDSGGALDFQQTSGVHASISLLGT